MSLVLTEFRADKVAVITLNDPGSLNAMSEGMAREFRSAVQALSAKPLRCIILTGAGKAFSAGGDLEMLEKKRSLSAEENRVRMLDYYDAFLSLRGVNAPIIAALNGHAIGAGLCLACACDIRLAATGAKLGFTFTRLGLHPGMGATYTLRQVVGPAWAAELMLTGRTIDAEEALRVGLVSRVVDAGKIMESANEIAAEILSCGPEATKQLLSSLRNPPGTLQDGLECEALAQAIDYGSAEFAEGIRSIREKRRASF